MIKVSVGTNFNTKEVIVETSRTIRSVLEEQNLNYENSQVFLGGICITGAALDKTFSDFNITEDCRLTCTVKSDGGRL